MSTNPFRRSSLKDTSNSVTRISDTSELRGTTSVPLSVDTQAIQSTSQKHVNFASPPAVPISPISYPESPESTRISPAFHAAQPVLPSPANYTQALQNDPFDENGINEEDDKAISEALENARSNAVLEASSGTSVPNTKENAVKDTLSRFASIPRKPLSDQSAGQSSAPSKSPRQTMDVDAFKRLLLTGESGTPAKSSTESSASTLPQNMTSDSSSTADTASISQQSISEPALPVREETPRSSYEIDHKESIIPQAVSNTVMPESEGRKKPPPPKPRHGRPIHEGNDSNSAVESSGLSTNQSASNELSSTTEYAHSNPIETQTSINPEVSELNRTMSKRTPPAPPLTRRKTGPTSTAGKPPLLRNSSSKGSQSGESDAIPDTSSTPKTAFPPLPPPPPPSRRPHSSSIRRTSLDLPSTAEEADDAEKGEIRTIRPELEPIVPADQAPPSSKRSSLGVPVVPPPLPPPRRNRGSSRSSIEGPPSLASIGISGHERNSGEYRRPSNDEIRKASSGSHATEILADLAALQKEVDAARTYQR